jgi:hypothetical protein
MRASYFKEQQGMDSMPCPVVTEDYRQELLAVLYVNSKVFVLHRDPGYL